VYVKRLSVPPVDSGISGSVSEQVRPWLFAKSTAGFDRQVPGIFEITSMI
jgi:hypothetical protein